MKVFATIMFIFIITFILCICGVCESVFIFPNFENFIFLNLRFKFLWGEYKMCLI